MAKKITNKYNTSLGKVKKLVPNLCNKNKYLLCYQSLQLYLLKKSKKANKDFEKASLR